MPASQAAADDAAEEKLVWELLIHDFPWNPPDGGPVSVHRPQRKRIDGKIKFQLFEVAFTTLMSRLRPDYHWFVTPRQGDGGTDFIGRTQFLASEALGIKACITVGGQCKKHEGRDPFDRVAGSLTKMRASENPTFFLVALASNLTRERLNTYQQILQTSLHCDCHILQRREIEALLAAHLDSVSPLLREALTPHEAERVEQYLKGRALPAAGLYDLSARAPQRVLAGQPFEVAVDIRGVVEAGGGVRLRWRPGSPDQVDGDADGVTLVGPVGADHPRGAPVTRSTTHDDDPLASQLHLQLVSYAVGRRALGVLQLLAGGPDAPVVLAERALGQVQIVENVRPRFYDAPVRPVLRALDEAWEAAHAGAVKAVAVTGSGGAGKSRVVEEFALEVRRRGECVVSAKQANTLDYPRRLFVNLLVGLTSPATEGDLAEAVLSRIAGYDAALADAAAATVRGLVGSTGRSGGGIDDEKLVAVLLMLVRRVTRQRALLLHLQDLHWCTADVLELLERLLWQLEHLHGGARGADDGHGLLVVLEGRVGEEFETAHGAWSTRTFEAAVKRLGRPNVVRCDPYTPQQSRNFTRRLFEESHSANRRTPTALLDLQASVAERIDQAGGGSPFHILEQLKLLKHRGAVVQNPETGLHYIVRPDAVDGALPPTVAAAIEARWNYLRSEKPALAQLVWAAALLSERIPAPLFRRLWSALAPRATQEEIEATEFLAVAAGADAAWALRHENYFQTLRRLELLPEERARVLEVYAAWYGEIGQPTAQQRYDLARIHLAGQAPDFQRIAALLREARTQAEAAGDIRLFRRVLGTLLDDVCWPRADLFSAGEPSFLALCDDEVQLCHAMVGLGERDDALQRLERLDGEIEARMREAAHAGRVVDALQLKRFVLRVASVGILMNNRQPARAAQISAAAVADFTTRRNAGLDVQSAPWRALELELCYIHSVALALAGDVDGALEAGERAVALAREGGAGDRALEVVSTYANILLARDPGRSEQLLRETAARAAHLPEGGHTRMDITLNLAMCLIVLAHRDGAGDPARAAARLDEALGLLKPLFTRTVELGWLADAAAAALLVGLVHALRGDGADVGWFADAVNAAARSRQMETLWRAQLNLASSMHRAGDDPRKVGEHARAAYEILADTLAPFAQPELSHRFRLVRVPLAQAVRFLVEVGDPTGERALAQLPALQACFADPHAPRLRDDRGGFTSHEWLRVDGYDYVIY